MNEQRFETNDAPHVIIEHCDGQVVVKSWRQTAVSIQGAAFTSDHASDQTDAVHLTSQGDLFLAVPQKSRLTLGVVGGALTIKHVDGGIVVDEAQGEVTLHNAAAVQIGHARQNVSAQNISGSLHIAQADGGVSLRSVGDVRLDAAAGPVSIFYAAGHVTLGEMGAEVHLGSINGDVTLANGRSTVKLENLGGRSSLPSVAGDLWLVGGLRAGVQTFISAQTIYVYWPVDAPLRLFARAPHIDSSLLLTHEIRRQEDEQTILTGHIEEGETQLTLKAGQRVALKPLGVEPPRFSADEYIVPVTPEDELAQTVRTAVRAALAGSTDPAGLEDRLVTALAAALAGQKPTAAASPAPATIPTTETQTPNQTESRTQILQLVRDGLISIDQANLLLEALK
ncbi:MAG: hypothetical protein R6X34_29355 [Chloroflexota bacterium]